jgi:hypothetical protein
MPGPDDYLRFALIKIQYGMWNDRVSLVELPTTISSDIRLDVALDHFRHTHISYKYSMRSLWPIWLRQVRKETIALSWTQDSSAIATAQACVGFVGFMASTSTVNH